MTEISGNKIVTTNVVWLVEDNVDYRDTVRDVIQSQDDLACPHAFPSGEDLLEHLNSNLGPDALLVDISLPGIDGIQVVRHVHRVSPGTQMVMLTIHEDNDRIFDAICAGASGYMLKTSTPKEILAAVREAMSGGGPMTPQIARRVLDQFTQLKAPKYDYHLTDREEEVLKELINGGTKKEIGKALFIEASTVDSHMRHIYEKLHVHSKTEAVVKSIQENLV